LAKTPQLPPSPVFGLLYEAVKRPGEKRGGLELDLVLFNVLAQVPGLLQVMLGCKHKLEYNEIQQGSNETSG
jgi:hypothetical protein